MTQVLLATARINIFDSYGHQHSFRYLLDTGNMTSFITERVATKLNLPKTAYSVDIKQSSLDSVLMSFDCKPINKLEPAVNVDAIIL